MTTHNLHCNQSEIPTVDLRCPSDSEFLEVAQFSFDNFINETAKSTGCLASTLREKFGGPPTERTESDIWYIVESGKQRIGFVWFQVNSEDNSAFGWDIYLEPNFRSKGIGRQIMNKCGNELLKRGIKSAKICVFEHNLVARGLYQSLGFTLESFDETRRQYTLVRIISNSNNEERLNERPY